MRIGFGMLGDHRAVNRAQLGAGLFDVRAGGEAAEKFGHAMDATGDHGGGEVVRAGDDVGDDFSFGWVRHGGFEDADDGGGAGAAGIAGIEFDGLADDGRIAVERGWSRSDR